jgi:carbonic anhydrase
MKIALSAQSAGSGALLALVLALTSLGFMACNKTQAPTNPTSTSTTSNSNVGGPNLTIGGDAKKALDELVSGNDRFSNGEIRLRDFGKPTIAELAKPARPFAIILANSETVATPELIFDQHFGDIFVIRTVGNVIDKAVIGSIEYAIDRFQVPLIFVLGANNSDLIAKTVKGETTTGNIQFLVNEIKPAISKGKLLGGKAVTESMAENVRYIINSLSGRSSLVNELIKNNKITIAGGTYDETTGKVTFFPETNPSAFTPPPDSKAPPNPTGK